MKNQTSNYLHHTSDEILFIVKPSNWINAHLHLICLAIAFVFPLSLLLSLYKFFEIYYWHFEFRENTIIERKGIFSVKQTENHYFRIKSVTLEKPFLYRLVGLSILKIETSDYAKPYLVFNGIAEAEKVNQFLKQKTYQTRKSEHVRELDHFQLR